eukprot:CAMPEP_0170069744 /NCGR_PEP_ID=MMETSP0019_2-20121128/8305_1 /TAXON_ID=98059 /ORGANISM="Dinobryon sp., Strain UTEXLB2267" /LENGTH=484 /DNA_ID=CAMNT_0010277867 /DNA_START=136 /DNA_END=1586 /DNA_ORIENTATION=-
MTGIVEFISGQSTITESNIEDTLKEVKGILIDADVNLQVTNTLISKVKEKAIGMKVDSGKKPGEQFISLLAAELVDIMGQTQQTLSKRSDGRPNSILLLGLQGAGKTTACAKLANWALKQKYGTKILLVAADVYRPAAIEQLKTLGARLNVDVYSESLDANPVQICRRAFSKATSEGYDTVIFDTAGRQVVDEKLMDELRQIKSAVLPDEMLLVVDAMTGQEAATLTARFNQDVGITGAILTKMDGDTRGGAALSVRGVSGKPIKFVGVGEGMDDLEPFFPDRMASRILGLGDIQTLIEKAQTAMDFDKAAQIGKKMQKGDFDFDDFILQSQSVRKMGGMGGMLKMIPGMAGKITDEMLFEAEKRMKQTEIIVNAMTEEERKNPDLIVRVGGKKELVKEATDRRVALAKKSGVSVDEIDRFVIEFSNMRRMMVQQLKGMDLDSTANDPNAPMITMKERLAQEKKARKVKPSRGGGGGFGASSLE